MYFTKNRESLKELYFSEPNCATFNRVLGHAGERSLLWRRPKTAARLSAGMFNLGV